MASGRVAVLAIIMGILKYCIVIWVVIMVFTGCSFSEKIIVDTDAGTDDAMALFMLLLAEKKASGENPPKVVAVTAVNGNTKLDNVYFNVLKVLKLCNRLDIPVYKGAYSSILYTPPITNYYGLDGLGNVEYPLDPPDRNLVQKQHAVNALVEWVNEYPGEITLLAIGPLTNVAMAIRLDKDFLRKLNKLFIMGGAVEGRAHRQGLEFNFRTDPTANYIVLNGGDYSNNTIHLLSWEDLERVHITAEWRKDVFGKIDSDIVKFLNLAGHVYTKQLPDPWVYADPIAAALLLNPEIVGELQTFHPVAIADGAARGAVLIDYYKELDTNQTVNIQKKINSEEYKKLLLHYFS